MIKLSHEELTEIERMIKDQVEYITDMSPYEQQTYGYDVRLKLLESTLAKIPVLRERL